jgi:hypothetical protein
MTVREKRSEKLRRLGVGCPITRRDFFDGIAVTAAVAASPREGPNRLRKKSPSGVSEAVRQCRYLSNPLI